MPPSRSPPNSSIARPLLILISCIILLVYIGGRPSTASTPDRPLAKRQTVLKAIEPLSEVYTQRVIGLGDIHGDIVAMKEILRRVGLIDMRGEWIGGKAVIVQTGDLVDRGPSLIAITRFWDTLRPKAELAGGGVVNLLGNHEIMNALGDWRYVTPEDIASFGGERARRIALREGWIGQTWRTNYSITARIPFTHSFSLPASIAPSYTQDTKRGSSDTRYLHDPAPASAHSLDPFSHSAASFVHGGILPEYLASLGYHTHNSHMSSPASAKIGPIDRINEIGSGLMYSLLDGPASPMSLPRTATPEQRQFWSELGPMWARDYALGEDEAAICERAAKACEILGVRHLIMGHTPNFEAQVSRCGGKILLIDTGISKAYGGAHSALEILFTLTPVHPAPLQDLNDSSAMKLRTWRETEVVSAVYTGGRETEILARSERDVEIPVDVV